MMSLLSFLLPEHDRPSLNDLACMVETDHSHEALVTTETSHTFNVEADCSVHNRYASQRSSDFASWNLWEDNLRFEVLELTKRPFCAFGYDKLLQLRIGSTREMEGFCNAVPLAVPLEEPEYIAPGNQLET